jgi:ribosomal protein S18 acetylase RimI-like enzyme
MGELLFESHGITGAKFSDFVRFCVNRLGIESMPKMHLVDQLEDNNSFGVFYPDRNESHIATSGRHPIDVMRTVAHELVHARQRELKDQLDGATGSEDENQANALAGVLMREFAPQLFNVDQDLDEMGVGGIAGVAQPMNHPMPGKKKRKKKKTNEAANLPDGYFLSRPDYYDYSGNESFGRIVAANSNDWPDDWKHAIGLVSFSKLADEIVLSDITVRPDFRSAGVGEALVDALVDHAQHQGLPLRTTSMTDDGSRLFSKYKFDTSGVLRGKK